MKKIGQNNIYKNTNWLSHLTQAIKFALTFAIKNPNITPRVVFTQRLLFTFNLLSKIDGKNVTQQFAPKLFFT